MPLFRPSRLPEHPRRTRLFLLVAAFACGAASLGAGEGGHLVGDSRRAAVTDRRVELLGSAIVRYFEDMRAWPAQFRDLVTRPAGATRWAGSYIPVRFADFDDRREASVRDGWGRRLLIVASGFDARLTSRGPNGIDESGAGDDRGRWVNADQALWKETKRETRVLNVMLGAWQKANPNGNPPNSFEGVYGHMRSDGFIPSTAPSWKRDYWADAWGTKYKVSTSGSPPVRTVYSSGRP